jgi:hypothetical protein
MREKTKMLICCFWVAVAYILQAHGQEASTSSRAAFQARMDSINKLSYAHHQHMM